MLDSDYYALELYKAVTRLSDAEEFDDVQSQFNQVISRAQELAREKFAHLAHKRGNEVMSDLHEDSVRAQGGL